MDHAITVRDLLGGVSFGIVFGLLIVGCYGLGHSRGWWE